MSSSGQIVSDGSSHHGEAGVKAEDSQNRKNTDSFILQDRDAEKAAAPTQPGRDVPDGGAAAWLVVLGGWCTSFCSFGWLNSIGVFQDYYQTELLSSYSASTISWIPSLQIFFMMALGPFVGSLYDRYGPRWLLLGGSVMHIFGIMMASLSTQYYQLLLAQGVCSAIGVSAVFQPGIIAVSGWFNQKRGAAFGVMFTGSSIGGVIFPILISRLIQEVGFGWAMRTCAFLMLFLLIIANLTVRAFRPPYPQKVTVAQLMKPFTELSYMTVAGGFFFFSYGFFAVINYLAVDALSASVDPNIIQYLIPLLNAGSLFGRLISGVLGDKLGRFNMFIVVCYISGILILALWLPDTSQPALIAFAVLFGFFSGAYVSLIAPLIMAVSPISELGFRTGIVNFFVAIGGLTTNPINGAILASSAGWTGLKVFSGILCIIGTTFMLVARIRETGWKLLVRY